MPLNMRCLVTADVVWKLRADLRIRAAGQDEVQAMGRCVEGEAREQSVLFPERLEDWVAEDSMVRVIDVFVEELELVKLGFERAEPSATGRPG